MHGAMPPFLHKFSVSSPWAQILELEQTGNTLTQFQFIQFVFVASFYRIK
jgi:hypothetical protein